MEPVTVTMFGRLVSLAKTHKSGRTWHEHAEFARRKVAEGMPGGPGTVNRSSIAIASKS
jgi:hypothetical protein